MSQDPENPYNLSIYLANKKTQLDRMRKAALEKLRDVDGEIAVLATDIREYFTNGEGKSVN